MATHLANYWSEIGWDIEIVTMTNVANDFYDLRSGVKRLSLGLAFDSANVLTAVLVNLRRISSLRSVLRRERPDVALGMMTTANCLLSIATYGTGIPAIGSERIHPPKFPIGQAWSWLRRKTYPRLATVVAQTEKSAKWLRMQTGVHQVPVIPNPVIYPLVDRDVGITPEKIMGSTDFGSVLLAVGRLVPQKGFDRLLVAFSKLALSFPDWHLVILGEGSSRVELEQQVSNLNLTGRVFLPGVAGNVRAWYEASDLYVMTSRFEGFPNTLVEALAHGLPAVSVDCDTGPRDILRPGIDGLLVPQDDKEALTDALDRLMGDSALRRQYGKRAIEARDRFSVEKVARMWERLFDEVRA